ncbi:uncharacterized protein BXZ73DRAFT_106965 [Epithele typhae]|uniref:uncharacterized protein n=1 Tax=Epithele typhae TaxID=378194 RepID=UPI0020082601|nr:uncharacterized protein BXZ73DRAFT_106965 [Epithele typhae]KAH9913317.1 hypothetical protein BXZ73DRAFT_106965 [Epithele typhae]
MSFDTPLDFVRLLLCFTSLSALNCNNIYCKNEPPSPALDLASRRLISRSTIVRLRLSLCNPTLLNILMCSTAFQLRDLKLTAQFDTPVMRVPSQYHQLQSLAVTMTIGRPFGVDPPSLRFQNIVQQLCTVVTAAPKLRRLRFKWNDLGDAYIRTTIIDEDHLPLCLDLERALLTLALVRDSRVPVNITFVVPIFQSSDEDNVQQTIQTAFPMLYKHGIFHLMVTPALLGRRHFMGSVAVLAVSPSGVWIASSSDPLCFVPTIILWPTDGGEAVRAWTSFVDQTVTTIEYDCARPKIAFSFDSTRLVSMDGWSNTVEVWDTRQDTRAAALTHGEHHNHCSAVLWARDGTALATCSTDGTVLVWDMRTYSLLLRTSSDGRTLELAHPISLPAGFAAATTPHPDAAPARCSGAEYEFLLQLHLCSAHIFSNALCSGTAAPSYAPKAGLTTSLLASPSSPRFTARVRSRARASCSAPAAAAFAVSPDGALVATASARDGATRLWRRTATGADAGTQWECVARCVDFGGR